MLGFILIIISRPSETWHRKEVSMIAKINKQKNIYIDEGVASNNQLTISMWFVVHRVIFNMCMIL